MKSTDSAEYTYTAGSTGSCLCGGVSYLIKGDIRHVVNCFCKQCQKTGGNFVAATRVAKDAIMLTQDSTLKWFTSSPGIRRGFCTQCGGNLFWDNAQGEEISIMAGTLDQPTGLKTTLNIYTADASDFHILPEIAGIE
ncbi:MAG: hypothetical protein ACI9J2_002292 [Saprospiraceae bacterium]|jgi:hypothetical protein